MRLHYSLNGREQVGLVDLLFEGIPRSAVRNLDLEDLRDGPVSEFSVLSLNPRPSEHHVSRYYGQFLSSASIGYLNGADHPHFRPPEHRRRNRGRMRA